MRPRDHMHRVIVYMIECGLTARDKRAEMPGLQSGHVGMSGAIDCMLLSSRVLKGMKRRTQTMLRRHVSKRLHARRPCTGMQL